MRDGYLGGVGWSGFGVVLLMDLLMAVVLTSAIAIWHNRAKARARHYRPKRQKPYYPERW